MKFLPPLISWEVCQTISPKELTNKNAEIILYHSLINSKSTPFKGVLGYSLLSLNSYLCYSPWKLTYPLKIDGWMMIDFLLRWSLFRGYDMLYMLFVCEAKFLLDLNPCSAHFISWKHPKRKEKTTKNFPQWLGVVKRKPPRCHLRVAFEEKENGCVECLEKKRWPEKE